ncbi:ribosome maturation factor RimM [soil metagenome]
MDIDLCYHLGYVIKPHGLKGEIVAHLDVDFPENYKNLESVFISKNKEKVLIPFFIEKIHILKNKATIKFEEIDSVEEADAILNQELYLPLESLPPLTGNQFYFHEIIDFEVVDREKRLLGLVKDVYNLPNQDLISMIYQNKEVLIPINDDTIQEVDRLNKKLQVKLPDGLLKIYLEE